MPGRTSLKRTVPSYQRQRAGAFVGAHSRAVSMGKARTRGSNVPYKVYSMGETKYFDVGINATVLSGASAWTATEVPCDKYVNSSGVAAPYLDSALIPSAPGVSYGQVSGNRFHMKKIRVRGHLTSDSLLDQGIMSQGLLYRLMLVHDSGPNGAQAQGEEVMQDVGEAETLYSFKRMASQGSRFRILKDQIGTIETSNTFTDGADKGTIGHLTVPFSFQYAPTAPLTISVKSAAAASAPSIGNLVDGNIFLLLQTNAKAIKIVASARCYYSDK